ncbi:MAG: gliding motility lipoprotein GldH [Flavobacteriales bacterium TMED191]|nr:MAG: gliding motility lipoprotein GldH [Flavobacteriales bacterium TMED191]
MTKYYKYFLIIFIGLFFISCDNKKSFIYKFTNNQWDIQKDTIQFTYNVDKTEAKYDVSLFLRNNLDYSYRNIYMFVEILHLNNIVRTDTIQYAITDKYGRWYGRGMGDTRDNYFLFESNMSFAKAGAYTFNITHGMRTNPLLGCNRIGLKISEND